HRGAQIDIGIAGVLGSGGGTPVQEFGLPLLEGALQCAVAREIHVVRNLLAVVDVHRSILEEREGAIQTRSQLKRALFPVPKTLSAPASPTAFGRMKIQFCHADSRPNTRVSIVSAPPKRRFASIPVSASDDR